MNMQNEKKSRPGQAKLLRLTRKIHRTTGALLFVFFLFVSVTGLLLGWKKKQRGVYYGKIIQWPLN